MIRYTLKCAQNHSFESWFKSLDAYESLLRSGQVTCPDCGSVDVEKSLMAPPVRTSRKSVQGNPLTSVKNDREAALAKLRKEIEQNSDYVGLNFATEARAMHEGNAPARSIHGEARPEEAKKLIEDGVPVAPLPFIPKSRRN